MNVKNDKAQKGPTILLVEDSEFLRELLVKKLISKGFVVLEASDGEAALSMLKQKEGIAMVLLDLVLPDVDGFEVLEKIRSDPKNKNLPVIVVSNLGQEEEVQRAFKLGATDYIIKANFTPSKIVEKVKEQFLKNKNKKDKK